VYINPVAEDPTQNQREECDACKESASCCKEEEGGGVRSTLITLLLYKLNLDLRVRESKLLAV
jgi:hypothetical protein